MASVHAYAQWLIENKDKKGSADFEKVAAAYRELRRPTVPEPEEETSLLGYIPETGKALLGGALGLGETVLTGASFLLPEEQEQAARASITRGGDAVREALAPGKAYEDNTYINLMQGLGSTAPFLALGPLGLPVALVAGTALGVASGAGEAAQRATAGGASEEDISSAAGWGTIPGALEMFGPGRILKRVERLIGPKLGKEVAEDISNSVLSRIERRMKSSAVGRITEAMIDEGVQEATSEIAQNLIQKGIYDPERGVFTDTGQSFGYGAGVGGLLEGLTELIIPGRRRGGRGIDAAAAEPVGPPTPPPRTEDSDLVGRKDSPTVLSADDLYGLGLDLDKSTANRLFGLDMAVPEQRLQARNILEQYAASPLVVTNKPDVVSRVNSLLRSEAFQTPEGPQTSTVESPTPQRDMIDEMETRQTQDMVDEDTLVQLQAEEDAALAAQEEARKAAELESTDAQVEATRQKNTVETRRAVLLPIIENKGIGNTEDLTRAFSAELRRQGFTNAIPTPEELSTIDRAVAVRSAYLNAEQQQAAEEAVQTTRNEVEQAKGSSPLEALIPEKAPVVGDTLTAPEQEREGALAAQRQAQNLANQQVRDRTGRGVEGQLEFPAAPRAKTEAPVEQEVAPMPQPAGAAFFDELGINPRAPIRKRMLGKDVNSPEMAQELQTLGSNSSISGQAKVNINAFLNKAPAEAAVQMDMFVPKAKAIKVETPVVEAPVVETPVVETPVVEAPVVEAPVVETPVVETPVVEAPVVEAPVAKAPVVEAPVAKAPVAKAPVAKAPVTEKPKNETKRETENTAAEDLGDDKRSFIPSAEKLSDRKGAVKGTKEDMANVDNVAAAKINARDKYTPRAAMQRVMEEGGSFDRALRIIAYYRAKPADSTVAKDEKNNTKVGVAASEWVRDKLSPETNKVYESYLQDAAAKEAAAKEADTYRNTTESDTAKLKRKKANEAKQAKAALEDVEGLTSYVDDLANHKGNKVEDNILTVQVINELISDGEVYDPDAKLVARSERETKTIEDLPSLTQAFLAAGKTIKQFLKRNAIAASMIDVSPAVSAHVKSGDLVAALTQLAKDSPNAQVRKTAARLAELTKGASIEYTQGLVDEKGEDAPGAYDAKTNTIQINPDMPLNTHTLLHEAAHAATVSLLANKSHPVTRKLTNLYNDVKGRLPPSYAVSSLEEFVAESFTNPEFQAVLAAHKPVTVELTAWQRFVDAVISMLGGKVGKTDGSPDSSVNLKDQTLEYINLLVSPRTDTRNATTVQQALSEGDTLRAVYTLMGGGSVLLTNKSKWESINRVLDNAMSWGRRVRMGVVNGMTLDNLVDMAKDAIPSAHKFKLLHAEQDGLRNTLLQDFHNKNKDYNAAFAGKGEDLKNLGTLVSISTIDEVDPSVTNPDRYSKFGFRYLDQNQQVQERYFANEKARDAAIDALPEGEMLGKPKFLDPTPERTAAFKEALRLYNSLNKDQQGVYKSLRDMYKELNKKIMKALDARLDSLEVDPKLRSTIRDRIFSEILSSGVIEPYFKLDRKGEYWLAWTQKKPGGGVERVVSAFETTGDRNVVRNRLEDDADVDATSIEDREPTDIKSTDYDRISTGLMVKLLAELKKPVKVKERDANGKIVVDANGKPVTKEAKVSSDVIEHVSEILFSTLPEQGLLKSHKHRENIAGFEANPLKVFRDNYPGMANGYANILFDTKLEQVANAMREELSSPKNKGNAFVKDLVIAMVGNKTETDKQVGKLPSYLAFARNPYLPNWARRLRSSSFVYTLGFNVSSAAVNMSTLPMIVGPLLSGKSNPITATKAMAKAMDLYLKSMGDVKRTGLNDVEVSELGGFSFTNEMGGPLGPLKDALKRLGLDTRTIAAENADYENPAGAPFLNRLAYMSGFIFNHGERAIRQVTAASHYIMEMEAKYGKPIDKITAAELKEFGAQAAENAVEFMEFANSSALLTTAPRWAQTGIGAVMYQFHRFPAQVAYIQFKMLHAIKNQMMNTKRTKAQIEEDKALSKAFGWMAGTGALLAGAKGIPLYGIVAAIANMFLDEDEDDFNTMMAKMVGDGAFYGQIANLGGVDVTDRVALTNLLIRDRGNYRATSDLEALVGDYGGPAAGITIRLMDNIQKLADGDPANNRRAFEAIMPSALANPLKGLRFAQEGFTTTRGDPITGDFETGDAVMQLLGFAPAKYRAEQDKLSRDRRVTAGTTAMRKQLLDRFAFAHRNNDDHGKEAVVEAIQEFNEAHPEANISGDNIRQSIKTRARGSAIAAQLGGNVADRRYIRLLQDSRDEYDQM